MKKKKKASLAKKLSNNQPTDDAPHLIIEARAGTGKTTTLVEGLKIVKGLDSSFTPSPQQAALWDAMMQSKQAKTVCFVAFNKAIATELQDCVPKDCDAMTMHSLGFKAVRNAFGKIRVTSWRVQDIISELLETDIRELRKKKFEVLRATEKLVSLCKQNLVGEPETGTVSDNRTWAEALAELAAHYDVDLNGNASEVFALVPRVLDRCEDVARDGCVDFNDMIWLPIVLNLSVFKYDLLLVDECQDLNRCQQSLAKRTGRRLILCGDSRQAIYGFAGADAESMNRLQRELSETDRGCETLPLTVTRRCGKAIVREAQKIVPDFEAHETNGEGQISYADIDGKAEGQSEGLYRDISRNGDMVLCRCNAPLVSECFKYLRSGIKASIQGRDVGQGLISTIQKQKASDVITLVEKLSDWYENESAKESRKRNSSEGRLIALRDRYDCLCCFCEDQTTVDGVVKKIEAVFDDNRNGEGIKLSSVHKAKGLEAKRVFILLPENAGMPHPMAKSKWQREQEMNLKYVAITRSIEELVYVS